jgi:uncharacterized cupin superfamily protein
MNKTKAYPHLIRAAEISKNEGTFSHPWNTKSEITGTHMSKLGGLSRTGVSLVRIAPGKESFAYHLHHREEEWIYVLSGKALTRIDGAEYEMAAGDFVPFPTPSVAHIMANPFSEELVYLMGGETRDCEVADFPDLGKRMLRTGDKAEVYELGDGRPFEFDP